MQESLFVDKNKIINGVIIVAQFGDQFLLELSHPNLEVVDLFDPIECKIGGNQEVPKDINHAAPKDIATKVPHHLLNLEATEYLLEQQRKWRNGGHLLALGNPSTLRYCKGSGEEALGGWSIKVGNPPDAEVEVATALPTLDLLKTRSMHISSSSVSTSTTPSGLSIAGAGSVWQGQEQLRLRGQWA